LKLIVLMRFFIKQSLTDCTCHYVHRAHIIGITERFATVETEIKFREIAMQMLLAAMLINTTHTALEH
jgi:hypothetical protein